MNMTLISNNDKSHFQQQIHTAIKQRFKTDPNLALTFADEFFNQYPVHELENQQLDDVVGFIEDALAFLNKFTNRPSVKVYNPDPKKDKWQCKNSIVMVHARNVPFLMDSVRMGLNNAGVKILSVKHTALITERDKKGVIQELVPAAKAYHMDGNEAFLYFEITHLSKVKDLNEIAKSIRQVLKDVSVVNGDYTDMLNALMVVRDVIDNGKRRHGKSAVSEANQFLAWLESSNFTFLGYTFYQFQDGGKGRFTQSLGLLRDKQAEEFISGLYSVKDTGNKQLLSFNKLPVRSSIHRPAYPDHIVVRSYSERGKLTGEHHIVGLYTSSVYRASVLNIPVVREKVEHLYENINVNINSYNGKVIRQVLETYPRDELFQSTTAELTDTIVKIAQINERQQVRLFMRREPSGNFAYAMIYIPRDVFSTNLREQVLALLSRSVNSESEEFYTYYSESLLARTYCIFRLKPDDPVEWNAEELEDQITDLASNWSSSLLEELQAVHGEDQGLELFKTFEETFSTSYRENFSVAQAQKDIAVLQHVSEDKPLALSLCEPKEGEKGHLHFKIFHRKKTLALSDVIPVLERMHLKVLGEHPYRLRTEQGTVWLHDFELKSLKMVDVEFPVIKQRFEEAFHNIWASRAENDTFNGLVLSANIHWREVVILRAYAAYMKQTLFPFSKLALARTLMGYPKIARLLVDMFHHTFDPNCTKRDPHAIQDAILKEIDEISSLNDDRILRRFLDMINGTLRTNFYQQGEDGCAKDYVSFKFAPREISNIPEPRPMFEIFVYSPRVEGVHLRGSKVARGGLRWSDRHEDFRTEVLGLVKAQQVKNAVIVPSGAKGGFIAKKASMDRGRDAFLKEGISCYQTFIRGLLDITDNFIKGKVVPPVDVVRKDEDDPYLVVAADKGTATFSDIANKISIQYGHWLGDAFASGGSQGYDHKGMGITARGAWVSVQRHFKEMGMNIQKEDFTVVGIGDMGGDVFGNGMLLSEHICLTAAFNHLHIFIDPNPNAAKTFVERKRLFTTPGTSWEDFDSKLISKGGGIFSRSAKSIAITAEMQQRFDITADKLTPNELISALLKAPVDLIWNGGIGTYVKAATETHADIGDKTNDSLRVNGAELRCKVFGEGGNLGMSQRGRIEFSINGGACNTDFIDNAAGVDCSDHEVNIKILLNEQVANGNLSEPQRNKLLASMTDTVAEMVLDNNYYQTQSISLAQIEALERVGEYRRLIAALESSGRLNRALEFIPSDDELTERTSEGSSLTRPELAVLNCYVKVQLKEELAVDSIANDEYLAGWVEKAFPHQLLKKYQSNIHNHILRKEIIATQLANDMVDNMGITFCQRLVESTGETAPEIALAYVVARDVFQFDDFQEQVEALDYKVAAEDQLSLLVNMMRRVRRGTRWFLRNRRGHLNPKEDIATFEKLMTSAAKGTADVLSKDPESNWHVRVKDYEKLGLKRDWAELMAMPGHLFSGLGIVESTLQSGDSVERVVAMHQLLGDKLGLYWFANAVTEVKVKSHWQASARESFIDDIDKVMRVLSVHLLRLAGKKYQLEEALQLWMQEYPQLLSRWRSIAHELQTSTNSDFAMFSVAMRELMDLTDACQQCKQLKYG